MNRIVTIGAFALIILALLGIHAIAFENPSKPETINLKTLSGKMYVRETQVHHAMRYFSIDNHTAMLSAKRQPVAEENVIKFDFRRDAITRDGETIRFEVRFVEQFQTETGYILVVNMAIGNGGDRAEYIQFERGGTIYREAVKGEDGYTVTDRILTKKAGDPSGWIHIPEIFFEELDGTAGNQKED